MAIIRNLGGDRVGSGNKMNIALHNYERSTHDLGNIWRSTMAPGMLVPCYCKLATNGDTWSMDLSALVRTMPAIGPLFGTYKLQIDCYSIPIRLYQGLLHNNLTSIGMDMAKVKLPMMLTQGDYSLPDEIMLDNWDYQQISPSSLMHYLGLRGVGGSLKTGIIVRSINAIPMLAYYDIFKNYYANKQEKKAFVVSANYNEKIGTIEKMQLFGAYADNPTLKLKEDDVTDWVGAGALGINRAFTIDYNNITTAPRLRNFMDDFVEFTGEAKYCLNYNNAKPYLLVIDYDIATQTETKVALPIGIDVTDPVKIEKTEFGTLRVKFNGEITANRRYVVGIGIKGLTSYSSEPKLESFDLDNIDRMRIAILRDTGIGNVFNTQTQDYLPYNLFKADKLKPYLSQFPMVGLCCKTYQSDYFNNWLNTEWINGENGINEISSVAIVDGKFTIDALNLAEKVYDMLNRVAASGGSYKDWQEAIYGEKVVTQAESPIYCGGMSAMIGFEEVISTSDAYTEMAGDQPLGSLAGKGTAIKESYKGGQIEIHVKEPSFIMLIASITPIIDYCQGNEFYLTELESINDLHKPALDGIGFQNLMLERAAWWGTQYDSDNDMWIRHGAGKLPAWLDYMTSVNEVHGEFAEKNKLGWMVLTRDYEKGNALFNGSEQSIPIADFTTYINPTKFNYTFANTNLDAQNFWVQIGIKAIVRRKISAKQIPNL